jgi:hypothetical protein
VAEARGQFLTPDEEVLLPLEDVTMDWSRYRPGGFCVCCTEL